MPTVDAKEPSNSSIGAAGLFCCIQLSDADWFAGCRKRCASKSNAREERNQVPGAPPPPPPLLPPEEFPPELDEEELLLDELELLELDDEDELEEELLELEEDEELELLEEELELDDELLELEEEPSVLTLMAVVLALMFPAAS